MRLHIFSLEIKGFAHDLEILGISLDEVASEPCTMQSAEEVVNDVLAHIFWVSVVMMAVIFSMMQICPSDFPQLILPCGTALEALMSQAKIEK